MLFTLWILSEMGSWYSTQSSDSIFLIGKLNGKTSEERKFFSLAEKYLQQAIDSDNPTTENGTQESSNEDKQLSEVSNGNNQIEEITNGCKDVRESTNGNEELEKSTKDNENLIEDDNSKSYVLENKEITDLSDAIFLPKPRRKKLFFYQTYVQWRANINFEFLQKIFLEPKKTIYLVRVTDFPDFVKNFSINMNSEQCNLFELIRQFLDIYFLGMDVRWLDDVCLEETNWNITERCHILTEQLQYLVTDFFQPLQDMMPNDGYCIMGFSWTDLYPEDKYNFALGEASCRQHSGVFSFGRFPPSKFNPNCPKDIVEITVDVLWKLLKVSSHEIGHLFGMEHCEFFHCHMNESLSMSEAMNQPLFLCPVCLKKIQHVCQFDIQERYQRLEKFFVDINHEHPSDKWTECILWLKKCQHFLENT